MDYTSIAGHYDDFESRDKTLLLLGYPAVIKSLMPLENKKILDYGCGTGMFSRILRESGVEVTGVDVSSGMVEIARKRSPEGNFYTIHSGNLDRFADDSFDHVVSNFVFCAIPETSMIRNILKEIFRVIKPNGSFIMMNSNWDESNGREFVCSKLEYCDTLKSGQRIRVITKSDPPIIFEDYFRSKKEYTELMRNAGFRIDSIEDPLASENECQWLDERKYPPYYLIVAGKTS